MGVDMLEHNELGALSESRLGSKSFVTDNDLDFSNFSITSKKEKTKRKEASVGSIQTYWAIDPKYADDCDYMQLRLTQLGNTIQNELSKNPSKTQKDRVIYPLQDMESMYKNEVERLGCVASQQKKEAETTKKETIDIINKATTPPSATPTPEGQDNTTKYIIYGVGGAIVLIGLIILLRK